MPLTVALRPRDLVRLDAHIAPPAGGVANLQTEWGEYYRAHVEDGNIHVRRSDFSLPPFTQSVQVTSTGDDAQPCLLYDASFRVWLMFTRGGTDVYQTFSDDDGNTWSDPTVAFAGGSHSGGCVHPDGLIILRAAYVSGQIEGMLEHPGETETFTFVDGSGTPLSVADDCFSLAWAKDDQDRILLSVTIDGESNTSDWCSTDEGHTWTRIL